MYNDLIKEYEKNEYYGKYIICMYTPGGGGSDMELAEAQPLLRNKDFKDSHLEYINYLSLLNDFLYILASLAPLWGARQRLAKLLGVVIH